jgi:hypothetical protein
MNKLRIEHLKKTNEHCISVIALCRVNRSEKAAASYEARLLELNQELQELLKASA